MKIRDALISDVESIGGLISSHAELDRMLFRSQADICENLQSFVVAEEDNVVVGCCALQVLWKELAEVKSLAVDEEFFGRGAGKELVTAVIEQAERLGFSKVFTLTLEPEFFERLGFVRIEKESLPMKVWRDCARCSRQDNCDEIALIRDL